MTAPVPRRIDALYMDLPEQARLLAGEFAELAHLIDPLDHDFESLAAVIAATAEEALS